MLESNQMSSEKVSGLKSNQMSSEKVAGKKLENKFSGLSVTGLAHLF